MYKNLILVEEIKNLLKTKNKNLSTVESATCGLLAYTLTIVDEASSFYNGSILAYDKKFKESFFKNKYKETISFNCTEDLAYKTSNYTNTSYSIAVCGNCGPIPIENKPNGLFTVTIYDKDKNHFENFSFQITPDNLSRQAFQVSAVNKIIFNFLEYLKKSS